MKGKVNIFNIQHFSLHDGPGIRTVVFFKGCPLNCVWCHNPESKKFDQELSFAEEKCMLCGKCVSVCKNRVHTILNGKHKIDRKKCCHCGACSVACNYSAVEIIGKSCSYEEILSEISKDDVFFADNGGVTFSGGEPFMQFEALCDLLKRCKQKNYNTAIETGGMTDKNNIIAASKYTDLFLYDCKETDANNHKRYTGFDNSIILENLFALDDVGANTVLRCPIIPKINDREEHFFNIAQLAELHSSIKSVELMPYHPLGISKSVQIGRECLYNNMEFLSKDLAEKYAEEIKKNTSKKVIVSI